MFYNTDILTRKGPLARVWVASHLTSKLSKSHLLDTNIPDSVRTILDQDEMSMALRLSGQLLLGVSRIYAKKAKYLVDDCTEVLAKVRRAFAPETAPRARPTAVETMLRPQFDMAAITLKPNQAALQEILAFDPLANVSNVDLAARGKAITLNEDHHMLGQSFIDETDPGLIFDLGDDVDFDLGLDDLIDAPISPTRSDRSIEMGRDAAAGLDDSMFDIGIDELDKTGGLDEIGAFDRTAEIDMDRMYDEDAGLDVSMMDVDVDATDHGHTHMHTPMPPPRATRRLITTQIVDDEIEITRTQAPVSVSGAPVFLPLTDPLLTAHGDAEWLQRNALVPPAAEAAFTPPVRKRPRLSTADRSVELGRDVVAVSPSPALDDTLLKDLHADETFAFDIDAPEALEDPSVVELDISHADLDMSHFNPMQSTPRKSRASVAPSEAAESHTTDTVELLQDALPTAASIASFDQLSQGMGKRAAATLFFDCLVLSSRNRINLAQEKAYADISIAPTSLLRV